MRPRVLVAVAAIASSLAACGSSSTPRLRVAAAASLRKAFGEYAGTLRPTTVSFSFAGSDALAAQLQAGARPDVFASANTRLPGELFAMGLVEKPVEFAANRLVLAVPVGSPIGSLSDASRGGVKLALGSPTVPIGGYTEAVLRRLPAARRRALLGNVRDREPDVSGIVGKLTEGAVDAGFLYATDVRAAPGLKAIAIPTALQPRVGYAAAVVRGGSHTAAARAFIDGLLKGAGRRDLLRSGFLAPAHSPPPSVAVG